MTDMVTFSTYCGCYAHGAWTGFVDSNGGNHTIFGDGSLPRRFRLDGSPATLEQLKRVTAGHKLWPFRPAG